MLAASMGLDHFVHGEYWEAEKVKSPLQSQEELTAPLSLCDEPI